MTARLPVLMGVVNVTPDSFSDGGRFAASDAAVAQGLALRDEGADLVDVGGESTRPGATRPVLEEELGRVIPVISQLAREGVAVSVDTMRHEVARAALEAGATMVNDVSGGLADPQILQVVAEHQVSYVAMHWRAHSQTMQDRAQYDDVVAAVRRELSQRAEAVLAAGLAEENLILDPGLGFAKTAEHNWELLENLDPLKDLGFPLLVGASRKSFLGSLLVGADGQPRPVDQREAATVALTTILAREGVWGIRVHEVQASRDALAVVGRMRRDRN